MVLNKQRLDGFVSADASYKGGWLKTPPIIFLGNKLMVNIDTESTGFASIELQSSTGVPIKGFKHKDCDVIYGNYLRKEVSWNGSKDVSPLKGKIIKIHFKMRSAKLYAFQFLKANSI